jgi:Secretion system C-terminal sorting domain/Right handed beta helix region
MQFKPLKCKSFCRSGLLSISFFLPTLLSFLHSSARQNNWQVDSTVNLIDGLVAPYNTVRPGDTIFLKTGNRDKLLIRNFKGTEANPISFMNKDGIVTISTNSYYGISINNCQYIRFSGQGIKNEYYGIQIKKVLSGCGIGIGSLSSDFEIDHVSVENCLTAGIYAKTDPDCSFLVSRDNFTQFNTSIHDNYIAHTGDEGMYIGSSFYTGAKLTCNGRDTIVFPPVLVGVEIYNNTVSHTGWDGIQVSSAPLNCRIFNNKVTFDSEAEMPNQMSGILIGGGSACDCNNNLIADGKGDGIEDHGLAGRIFNNIIVNAGKTYLPNDLTKMKYGIFISDVSALKDSAFTICFNDIIDPKSDGIRFQSIRSRHNRIFSNLIINPGNYNLYEHDNTTFSGRDAYVMIPNRNSDVKLQNNLFSLNIQDIKISLNDYSILAGSPLINTGISDQFNLLFDFYDRRRPVGGLYDIGAIEYNGGADTLLHTFRENPVLFPNPAYSVLNIKYLDLDNKKTVTNIYSAGGKLVLQQAKEPIQPGLQELHIDVRKLQRGIYFYTVQDENKKIASGKFIKL